MKVKVLFIYPIYPYPALAKKSQAVLTLRDFIEAKFNCISLFSSHQ
jgi:hypothetical protein